MTKLSKYLTLDEATKSPTAIRQGINNTPNEQQIENMKYVALEVFDPTRDFVGGPLAATSFFRSPMLNAAIGGSSKTSDHMLGSAIDIDTDVFGNSTNRQVFYFIKENLNFKQLILEYPDALGNPSWVHVSLSRDQTKNKKQVLVKLKAEYIPFEEYKVGMI